MGLVGVFAMIAASVTIAVAAIAYALRRGDALAWGLALTAVASTALVAVSNWVAISIAPGNPTGIMAVMRFISPASAIVSVMFSLMLALVLVRDSKRPSGRCVEQNAE